MKTNLLKQLALILTALFALNSAVSAQVSITKGGEKYTQDFNTLAKDGATNTWSNNTTIKGWYAFTSSSGTAVSTYGATESTTGAGMRSYGSGTATDRAFGTRANHASTAATGTSYFGFVLQNNTEHRLILL